MALGTLLLAAACGPGYDAPPVDLSQTEAREEGSRTAVAPEAPLLRMAVAPVISPRETFASHYRDLLQYVGDALEMQVELVQGKTYAEINDLVRSGDITLAFVCTNPYLQGQEDFGMELLVAPEVEGQTSYYSYLIARSDSDISSLDDLRGRVFAFSDPLSNSGRLVPVYQLVLKGETPETFFDRYIFTYAHDNSIKAVAEGLVDGAAVDSLVYDYWAATGSGYAAETKIVDRWGPFGINPVVVHPGLDADLKDRLREVLLTMDQDPQGSRILSNLHIDRFVVPDVGIYDSVRAMRAYMSAVEGEEGDAVIQP
ncbi:MAG: phosphate/phosphite/phosphonate ABC transporter substrate-binding protein [Dehalococcoidia bacterium]